MKFITHTSPTQNFSHQSRNKGFSLVELVVVMAIITTLLAVGVGTIKGVAGSKGVSTGVSLAEGVFDSARTLAKANGAARVIIYADETGDKKDQRERYLRYMAVQKGTLRVDGDPDTISDYDWALVSAGTTLPSDTYFNVNLSVGAKTEQTTFPGIVGSKKCYFYAFNSEGGLIDVTAAENIRFLIQAGKLIPGQTVPREIPTSKRDVGGFRIWSTGKTSIFRSPSQIVSGDPEF